jgi:hypothetical protein
MLKRDSDFSFSVFSVSAFNLFAFLQRAWARFAATGYGVMPSPCPRSPWPTPFISYRVVETADVSRVADEAGNSVAIIRQHYLRRVKPAEAARWFAIAPEAADNVVQLKAATKKRMRRHKTN